MRVLLFTILLLLELNGSGAFSGAKHQCLQESLTTEKVSIRLAKSKTTEHGNKEEDEDEPEDTVRVRIWRALAAQNGREMSLAQLANTLGERRSDVRHHLSHVEKQCKTLQSKSEDWRLRRGLPAANTKKLSIKTRRKGGKRNELFIKLQ